MDGVFALGGFEDDALMGVEDLQLSPEDSCLAFSDHSPGPQYLAPSVPPPFALRPASPFSIAEPPAAPPRAPLLRPLPSPVPSPHLQVPPRTPALQPRPPPLNPMGDLLLDCLDEAWDHPSSHSHPHPHPHPHPHQLAGEEPAVYRSLAFHTPPSFTNAGLDDPLAPIDFCADSSTSMWAKWDDEWDSAVSGAQCCGREGSSDGVDPCLDVFAQSRGGLPPCAFDQLNFACLRQDQWGGQPCSVCFEAGDGVAVQLPCGHVFHADCMKQCFKFGSTCPNCRAPL